MDKNTINELLQKYVDGTCNLKEKAIVESWYNKQEIKQYNCDSIKLELIKSEVWNRIKPQKNRIFLFRAATKLVAAATILLFGAFSLYYFVYKPVLHTKNTDLVDVQPGKSFALFTTSNGQSYLLPPHKNGVYFQKDISQNYLSQHLFSNSDFLTYYSMNRSASNSILFNDLNRITTPLGANYQIILEDGSKVWLNAGSSLCFPSNFKERSLRVVYLIGEAYFEIAKDNTKPFSVKYNNNEVNVLGTKFNINAYSDTRKSKVTLLEGVVELVNHGVNGSRKQSIIMKPLDQAIIDDDISLHKGLHSDKTTAWKDGVFLFNDDNLSDILKEISRWYNIKIDYSSIPNLRFNGQISKYSKLSELLEMLEITSDIRFVMRNGMLTINTEKK